jgi:GT2 family glycosyltransferase
MKFAAVQAVGGFDRSFNVSPDTDLFMRLARLGKPAKIPRFLGALRIHGDSQTARKSQELAARDEEVRRRAGMPELPRCVRRALLQLFDWRFRIVRIANELRNGDLGYKVGMRLVPVERIET